MPHGSSRLSSLDRFQEKAISKHGTRYDYAQIIYQGAHIPVCIICNEHGEFSQTPTTHLQGSGCPKCGKTRIPVIHRHTVKKFIEKARKVHGNQYDYSLTLYEHSHKKVTIMCPIHGNFDQVASSHLEGRGCSACSKDKLPGSYTEEKFQTQPHLKNKPGIVYCIRLFDDQESFFKIGITTRTVFHRFQGTEYSRYSIEEITHLQTTLYEAFKREQYILEKCKTLKYTPMVQFRGWTECFVSDVSPWLYDSI